jgi:hypothetical protein
MGMKQFFSFVLDYLKYFIKSKLIKVYKNSCQILLMIVWRLQKQNFIQK